MRYESVVYACRVFWVLLALAGVGALAYFVRVLIYVVGYLASLVPLARWMRDGTSAGEAGAFALLTATLWPIYLAGFIFWRLSCALGKLT